MLCCALCGGCAPTSARALLAGAVELNGALRKLVGPRHSRVGSVGDGCSLRVVDGGEHAAELCVDIGLSCTVSLTYVLVRGVLWIP